MVPTLCLLSIVFAPAQLGGSQGSTSTVPRASDWVFGPRLSPGQELVYRGTFTEESQGSRVQSQRTYRIETRIFTLAAAIKGVEVGLLTTLKVRGNGPASNPTVRINPVSSAVRLERLKVDQNGKVMADPMVSLSLPLDGPPTLELGMFVEAPGGHVPASQTWEVMEAGLPARGWHAAGMETVNLTPCLKLVGVQQSAEWDRPRADRPGWRRTDTVWIAQRLGVASRVERVIERREAARRDVCQRSVIRLDLESSLQRPGSLSEAPRNEIQKAVAFQEAAAPLLPNPVKYNKQLMVLLTKVNHHLEHEPATPYREALLFLKQRLEAASRGEVPPIVEGEPTRPPSVATLGEPAPDFLASDFTTPGASARLANVLGKPVVLVFYHPSSVTAADVLGFAQEVYTANRGVVHVVGMSVDDDGSAVLKQRSALKLGIPMWYGGGLRVSYGVDTTPKIVVLDATGVVRGSFTGWGGETRDDVLKELRTWLPKPPGPKGSSHSH
jgi:hypothetical protein